jgi:hypothetical protein
MYSIYQETDWVLWHFYSGEVNKSDKKERKRMPTKDRKTVAPTGRVLRLAMPAILPTIVRVGHSGVDYSKLVGESEENISRFFEEMKRSTRRAAAKAAKARRNATIFAKKLHNPVRVLKAIREKEIPMVELSPSKWVGETERRFREDLRSLQKNGMRAVVINCTDYAGKAEAQERMRTEGTVFWYTVLCGARDLKRNGCRVYLRFRNELRRVYWRRAK